jgi:hypothetical protein
MIRRDFLSYLGGLLTVPLLGLSSRRSATVPLPGIEDELANAQLVGMPVDADFIAFDKDGFTINWSNVQQPNRTFEDQEPYGFRPPHQKCKKYEKDK